MSVNSLSRPASLPGPGESKVSCQISTIEILVLVPDVRLSPDVISENLGSFCAFKQLGLTRYLWFSE